MGLENTAPPAGGWQAEAKRRGCLPPSDGPASKVGVDLAGIGGHKFNQQINCPVQGKPQGSRSGARGDLPADSNFATLSNQRRTRALQPAGTRAGRGVLTEVCGGGAGQAYAGPQQIPGFIDNQQQLHAAMGSTA